MENTTVVEEEVSDLLDANDRCDKCGAQAFVLVMFEGDTSLMFCSHHWNESKEKLTEVAIDVIDETQKLLRR